MAPNEGRRNNPNAIDIGLTLLGPESEAAIAQLTTAIQAMNEHLQSADLPNTVANIQASNRVLQTYTRQDQVFEGGPSPTRARTQGGVGTVSAPEDAAGQAASRGGTQEAAQTPVEGGYRRQGSPSGAGDDVVDLHEQSIPQRLGTFGRRLEATRGAPWRRQQADPSDPGARSYEGRGAELADLALSMARPAGSTGREREEEDPAVTGGVPSMGGGGNSGDGGDRSTGASSGGPGDPQPNDPALGWIRHARLQNLDQPIQFPRFGELTTQDKLRMASDWMARNQLQRNDRAPEGQLPGQMGGRAAAALGIAANNYAQYRVIRDNISRFGEAVGVTRSGEQGQAGLGYSQQGGNVGFNIFGTEIGGELPIIGPLASEAGRQNIRREFEIRRLGASPQISTGQAREIYDTINQQGYSGGEADNLALRLYQPLVRQGMSPGVVGQATDEAYRYGNTSIEALRESLSNLGDMARNTRQSVDQAAEGLSAFAQTAAEHGATLGSGLQTGREFVAATGQRAEVGARALQNPLFQAIAMRNTGLLPEQLGTMRGEEIASTQAQVVQMAMNMTRGFNRPRTERVTDARGNVITRQISGRDAQIAVAAERAGMDVETFRQTLRHQDHQSRFTAAEAALGAWRDDVNRARAGDETGDRRGAATRAENALQRGGGGRNNLNWNQVAQELADAGVSRERIQDISRQSFGKRAQSAQSELEKISDRQRTSQREQRVEIRLTGMAEKLFQAKFGGGNKFGHSNTTAWTTPAGVGIDTGDLIGRTDVSRIVGSP